MCVNCFFNSLWIINKASPGHVFGVLCVARNLNFTNGSEWLKGQIVRAVTGELVAANQEVVEASVWSEKGIYHSTRLKAEEKPKPPHC